MAAVVSRLSVGNQRERIARAFAVTSLEGTRSVPGGHHPSGGLRGYFASKGLGQTWWQDLIGKGVDIVGSRYGTAPGTLVQETPQGTITYRQPTGSDVTLPVLPSPMGSQATTIATPEGFATGMSVGMVALIGVGAVLLLTMRRR